MAYTYKKLTDVDLIDSAVEPNLLIEEGGDIKKISASNIAVPQVNADWEETDNTSPAFILNKPDLSQAGGGANIVTYTLASGALQLDGVNTTAQAVADEWSNGSILRIRTSSIGTEGTDFYSYKDVQVNTVTYQYLSGSITMGLRYIDPDTGEQTTITM